MMNKLQYYSDLQENVTYILNLKDDMIESMDIMESILKCEHLSDKVKLYYLENFTKKCLDITCGVLDMNMGVFKGAIKSLNHTGEDDNE